MATLQFVKGNAQGYDVLFTSEMNLAGMGEDDVRAAVLAEAQIHLADVSRATPTGPVKAGRNGKVYVSFAGDTGKAPDNRKASPADAARDAASAPRVTVARKPAPQPADVDTVAQMLFAYGAFDTLDAAREAVIAKQEARKAQADALLAQMDELATIIKAHEADLATWRAEYAALQAQLADLGRQP